MVGTLSGCISNRRKSTNDDLVSDLRSALGNQWKVSSKSNTLMIVSASDLPWVFDLPSPSHEDAHKDSDVYLKPIRHEYRIEPFVTQAEYRDLYLAMQKKKRKLQQEVARLEKAGMPEIKGVLNPRNKYEEKVVAEYTKAKFDVTTLPVYHYRGISLFNAKQKPVIEIFHERPASEATLLQMKAFRKGIEAVCSKYEKPQQDNSGSPD